jgi:hypothetical protein
MNDGDEFKIDDGIIDKEKWALAKPKILFLLKESTKRSCWVQIAGVPIDTQKGDNRRFWPNVLCWKHAVSSAFTKGRVPEYTEVDTDEFRTNNRILDDIAYVNVNKKLGGSKSDDRVITKIAFDNRLTLGKQIDEIDPTVVFCCYTQNAYRAIYEPAEFQVVANDIYFHKNRFVIQFYHPSNRRTPEDLYEELSSILRQEAFINRFTTPATSVA